MKTQAKRFLPSLILLSLGSHSTGIAAEMIKANNADALNLTTSWSDATVPGATDVAVWDNTVTAANSTNLGGALSWQGIRVANPGGLVTINHTAATSLAIGSAGIDMSATTQSLTFGANAGLVLGAHQTWNINRGSTLTMGRALTGSGNLNLTAAGTTGTAVVSTAALFPAYAGALTIGANVHLRSTANAVGSWLGTQTVTLAGGEVWQNTNGSVGWNNAFDVTAGTTGNAIVCNATSTGAIRSIALNGVISGGGTGSVLIFRNQGYMPFNGLTESKGFIVTRDSTFQGTIRVENTHATYGSFLRIGADRNTDTDGRNFALGGNNGSLHPNADIVLDNARAALLLMRNDAYTFPNKISGTGELWVGHSTPADTSTDNQSVNLTGTTTHTGQTKVLSGTLLVHGSLTGGLSVAAGARLGGTGSTTGGLVTASGALLGITGGATVAGLTVNGATFNGPLDAEFVNPPLAATRYDLLTYGGGGVVSPESLMVFARGTLTHDEANKKFTFTTTTGPTTLAWNTTDGFWDAMGTDANWSGADTKFYQHDSVVFGNIAADTVITKTGTVRPAGIVVANTANTYTFDGSGLIAGTTGLTKSGDGTLVLATANSYAGLTTLNGGTVRLGAAGALGSGSGPVVINSGCTLDTGGQELGTGRTITLAGGKITNSGAQQTNTLVGGSLTVTADSRLGGTGRWDIRTNSTVTIHSGVTLTKEDANLVYLNVSPGAMVINNGLVDMIGGDLALWGTTAISGTGTFRAGVGGTFSLSSSSTNPLPLTLAGGTLQPSASTQSGPVTVTANSTITLASGTGYISGSVSESDGPKTLTKTGAGTIEFTGTNSFAGLIDVQAGVFVLNSLGSEDGEPSISVATGARLAPGGAFTDNTATIGNLTGSGLVKTNYNTGSNRKLQIKQSTNGEFSGNIQDGDATRILAITKTGTATLTLSGVSSHTGPTLVAAGTLAVTGSFGNTAVTVADGATLAGNGNLGGSVIVQANGIHSLEVGATPAAQVTRTVSGALSLDAGNILNLTATPTPATGTYVLVTATGGITGAPTTVHLPVGVSGSVAVSGNNLELTVTAVGGDYDTWVASIHGFTDTAAGHDPDGDGLTNFEEYAFGLNPTSGASVSPVTPPNRIAGTFTYTRRKPSLTGLTYTHETSATLGGWSGFTPTSTTSNSGDPVETITVTVPAALLTEPALFFRVKAAQP